MSEIDFLARSSGSTAGLRQLKETRSSGNSATRPVDDMREGAGGRI